MARAKRDETEIQYWMDLLDTGMTKAQVAELVGVTKTVVAYHTKWYDPVLTPREISEAYTEDFYRTVAAACDGRLLTEVAAQFSINYQTVQKAKQRFGDLCTAPAEDETFAPRMGFMGMPLQDNS